MKFTLATLAVAVVVLAVAPTAEGKKIRKKVESAEQQQARRRAKNAKSYSCAELDQKVLKKLEEVEKMVDEANIDDGANGIVDNYITGDGSPSDNSDFVYRYECGTSDEY